MEHTKVQMLLLAIGINASYIIFFLMLQRGIQFENALFASSMITLFTLQELYDYSRKSSLVKKRQDDIITEKKE